MILVSPYYRYKGVSAIDGFQLFTILAFDFGLQRY